VRRLRLQHGEQQEIEMAFENFGVQAS
jgi:hypothetical protein